MPASERHQILEFDSATKQGVCSVCGPTRVKIRSENGKPRCIAPVREQNARYRNSGRRKNKQGGHVTPDARRRYRYGLEVPLSELLAEQQSRCAICRTPINEAAAHVDHDHACCPTRNKGCGKCVRGVLCRQCNHGLGNFKDRPDLLAAAARYLRSNRSQE